MTVTETMREMRGRPERTRTRVQTRVRIQTPILHPGAEPTSALEMPREIPPAMARAKRRPVTAQRVPSRRIRRVSEKVIAGRIKPAFVGTISGVAAMTSLAPEVPVAKREAAVRAWSAGRHRPTAGHRTPEVRPVRAA
jgi:hypothetical protein